MMTEYRRFYIPNATWFFTVNYLRQGIYTNGWGNGKKYDINGIE